MAGFTVTQPGGYSADLDALLVRRDLFNSGNLWTCGYNNYGALGNNSSTSTSSLNTVAGGGTTWRQVVGGIGPNVIAVKTDGTLWTWGWNSSGQLGIGSSINTSSPNTNTLGGTTWSQVAAGYGHTAAVKTDGTLWTSGRNDSGQLGNGSTIAQASGGQSSFATTVGGGTNWISVSCGAFQTAAIKSDGTLWTWGLNSYGALGSGSTTRTSSPNTTINGGSTWLQVACGSNNHTTAIKTDGTLWTCGYNQFGQLGNGTSGLTGQSSFATVLGGGTTWKQVSGGYNHTAAIKTDGTLWTCGYGTGGGLGNGSAAHTSSPGTVAGGGTTWKQVVAGRNYTAAIKTDGTLWTCGYNYFGGLGNGSTTNTSSFATVAGGGTTWKQVAGSGLYLMAITDLST
jgi:alpha-tubulin suppressor-like RCC1 family protein